MQTCYLHSKSFHEKDKDHFSEWRSLIPHEKKRGKKKSVYPSPTIGTCFAEEQKHNRMSSLPVRNHGNFAHYSIKPPSVCVDQVSCWIFLLLKSQKTPVKSSLSITTKTDLLLSKWLPWITLEILNNKLLVSSRRSYPEN